VPSNLKGNIWKYALLQISSKRVFAAILGAYYLTIPGVTPWWIGTILLSGSLAAFIFEIPSGYVADKIGHKTALVISRTLILFSTLSFLLAENIPFLILGSVFMSMGSAFKSGTGSAFMHETLRGLKREEEYSTVMGKISSIGFAVPIILMASVPFLVSISFKAPFLISLISDVVGLCAAISLVSPHVSQEHIEEVGVTNFLQVAREGHRLGFFRYALFSGIILGVLIAVGGFRAPYQTFLQIPVVWFGVLFGVGRAFAALMLAYSGKIKRAMKEITILYKFQLILFSVLFFALGVLSTWWAVAAVFIVINAFQWGLDKVDDSFLLDIIKASKFKATLLSIWSQIKEMATAVFAFGIGFVVDKTSYQYGFLAALAAFLIILLPLYNYIVKTRRKF
jgi:MFS family permease